MPFALAIFLWLVASITVALFIGKVWWLPPLISVHGAEIDRQLILTLIIAGIAFFLAQVSLGYLIWRFRARSGQRAAHWHENPRLEAGWTIATAVVFLWLSFNGNRIWASYILTPPPADALSIEVTAQQFAWNIRYAGPDGKFGRTDPHLINDANANYLGLDSKDPAARDDITTQNIIAVPVNRPVRVMLRTKDVTHSFFVPVLRVKQDTVPGLMIPIHFTATQTGEYEIACAELCGMQHYKMRARLLVMPEADFENWLKQRASMQ
jgi:cytochrome c oxidase subunit II